MSNELCAQLDDVRAQLKCAGEKVRILKKNKNSGVELEEAIETLKALQLELDEKVALVRGNEGARKAQNERHRASVERVLKSRFFVAPAFEIYNGVAGLYDYGPPGTGVKENLLDLWRKHFVLAEQMLEVSTTALTLDSVLKTSGHVDKFTDLMVKDVVTGEPYRADKLLEEAIDKLLEDVTITEADRIVHLGIRGQADAVSPCELDELLKKYNVKAPETNNDLSPCFPFNLMFSTQIGPTGKLQGYMRPETAQGIFTNFKKLLDCRGGKMPFAAAQVGLAFRNEISPRSGLLRVREFTLAEIEHFVHPDRKQHEAFELEASTVLPLLSRDNQTGEDRIDMLTARDAVAQRIIDNETLAYFMARTMKFLLKAGIKQDRLRFRQHKADEMAHYASDCWDAEVETTYGWIECVGHADRSCFDLSEHAKETNRDMSAYEAWGESREVEVVKRTIVKKKLGPKFRKDAGLVASYLEGLPRNQALDLQEQIDRNGSVVVKLCNNVEYSIEADMVKYEIVTEKQSGCTYVPAVIEPSFGIGRIVYCILEQSFYVRDPNEEPERAVLALNPLIAPIKVTVLPLSNNSAFSPFVTKLVRGLLSAGYAASDDSTSASIGKRYARADEIGVPFAVTVDFDTIEKKTVTIRERDSMQQIRIELDEVVPLLGRLIRGELSWTAAYDTHTRFFAQEASAN